MKDITQLSIDFQKMGNKVINNLIKAQSDTADDILSELKTTANNQTGGFINSLYKTNTKLEGNNLSTFIGSDMQVISSKGKSYNLGWLLETGTSPHLIEPVNAEYLTFEIDEKRIFTKKVNHPGTIAYNNYRNALNNNRYAYKDRISNAVKESFK